MGSRLDETKVRYWIELIEKYKVANLNQSKFCQQENISEKRFSYRRHRHRQGKLISPAAKPRQQTSTSNASVSTAFVPVKVAGQEVRSNNTKRLIEIFSPSGFVVRMPIDAGEVASAGVLAVMAKIEC